MYSDDRGGNVDEFLTMNCKVKSLFCCFLSAAPGVSVWVFCTDVFVYINKLNTSQSM